MLNNKWAYNLVGEMVHWYTIQVRHAADPGSSPDKGVYLANCLPYLSTLWLEYTTFKKEKLLDHFKNLQVDTFKQSCQPNSSPLCET